MLEELLSWHLQQNITSQLTTFQCFLLRAILQLRLKGLRDRWSVVGRGGGGD